MLFLKKGLCYRTEHGNSIYHPHPIPQFYHNISQHNPVQIFTPYFSNTPDGTIFEVLTEVLLKIQVFWCVNSVKW